MPWGSATLLSATRWRPPRAAAPEQLGDRPHRRRDDGEPVVRPLPRLAARRRRQAGRADLHRPASAGAHARSTRPSSTSCGFHDPDHSYEGGRIEFNDGRCDGWLRAGENDSLSISYYEQADLAFLGQAALDWTTCDRYFAATLAETYPNRFYQHSAKTDRLHNSTTISTMPTIWDRLTAKGRTGTYYFSDVPFLALWGTKYLVDREAVRQLPDRRGGGHSCRTSRSSIRGSRTRASGTSADDHPHADIRAGEAFLNQVYTAVTTGAKWANTLLVINYDEWGGFYDHVAPGRAGRAPVDGAARLPRARDDRLAARAAQARRPHGVRPHVDPAGDRVALGTASADPSRRAREQHRAGARLRRPPGSRRPTA